MCSFPLYSKVTWCFMYIYSFSYSFPLWFIIGCGIWYDLVYLMFIIFIDLLKEPVLGVTGLLCHSLFRISLPQRSPSFSYFLGASGAPQTAPHLVWGWTPPGQSHLPAPHFLNPLSPSASKFHMKICSKVEHSSQILQEKPMCGF